MACAKPLFTGLVAGLIAATEAAATPAWRDSVEHAAYMADNLDDFVGEHDYPFPIALDTGETYRRYGLDPGGPIPQSITLPKEGPNVISIPNLFNRRFLSRSRRLC
ncbi:MAG: hypothetical protein OXH81_11700 [Gemmatimonadetes bacterium]|nr:hypothetical protein [Gemmatimonadota bacterium]